MATVIIVHGTGGKPSGNWFPWLKKELSKRRCRVIVPKFPTPKGQSLSSWMKVMKKHEKHLDSNCIVVGHSLGPAFLLSVIEGLKKPISAAVFVAGFTGLLGNDVFDGLNKTFTTRKFNWKKIRRNCKQFHVINSDNDPYVKLEKGKRLAKQLGTKIVVVENGGHLGKSAGFTEFPLVFSCIKKELGGATIRS